jgi:PmbA protein
MQFDLLSIQEKSTCFQVQNNQIHGRKNMQIQRHGVRRFENGKMYQTSRLGAATKDRLIADTKEWGGPGTPHDFGFAPASQEKRRAPNTCGNVLESFEQGLEKLVRDFPQFIFSGKCTVQNFTTSLESSYGLDLKTSGEYCDWHLSFQNKNSSSLMDGFIGELTAKPNIEKVIEEQKDFLRLQGKIVPVQDGRMPVLFVENFDPLEKLKQSFKINRYEEGSSLYSGKLGQKLFSDKVSLYDCAYDADSAQFQFFDGEGFVRNENLQMIEKGVFKNLFCDLRFGKKYSRQSTGNGMRTYNRGVNLVPRSLRVGKGEKPWREIAKSLDRCLISIFAFGGESNDLGEYSSPVQIGYIMEKGEIIGQAPQLTVKTSINDYLGKSLIDISSDGFSADSPSACIFSEVEVMNN